jgi:hypothetical protein
VPARLDPEVFNTRVEEEIFLTPLQKAQRRGRTHAQWAAAGFTAGPARSCMQRADGGELVASRSCQNKGSRAVPQGSILVLEHSDPTVSCPRAITAQTDVLCRDKRIHGHSSVIVTENHLKNFYCMDAHQRQVKHSLVANMNGQRANRGFRKSTSGILDEW